MLEIPAKFVVTKAFSLSFPFLYPLESPVKSRYISGKAGRNLQSVLWRPVGQMAKELPESITFVPVGP